MRGHLTPLRDDLAFAVVPLGREKGEAILARWDALEAVVEEADRFLDLDFGYLARPTQEGLQPLIDALSKLAGAEC